METPVKRHVSKTLSYLRSIAGIETKFEPDDDLIRLGHTRSTDLVTQKEVSPGIIKSEPTPAIDFPFKAERDDKFGKVKKRRYNKKRLQKRKFLKQTAKDLRFYAPIATRDRSAIFAAKMKGCAKSATFVRWTMGYGKKSVRFYNKEFDRADYNRIKEIYDDRFELDLQSWSYFEVSKLIKKLLRYFNNRKMFALSH